MIHLIVKIFFIAFFINLLYELLQSPLYKTCLEASLSAQAGLQKYIYLILKAATFDGFSITAIYYLSYFISKSQNIFYNNYSLIIFSLLSLILAYFWEIYSVKNMRWEYSNKMPLILGAGITPVIQLALTGLLTVYIAFNFY